MQEDTQSPVRRRGRVLMIAGLLTALAVILGGLFLAPRLRRHLRMAQAQVQWQPQLHFYAGPFWNNDPNGPILLNGQYHLFYQLNPFGDLWGHMSWGHAVSPDLVHWKTLPVALAEENGVMIFNGATVEDRENSSGLCGEAGKQSPGCLVAVYTGNGKNIQNQNVAYSRNGGMTWTKYAGNPVIDLGLKDFRDPKIIWHEESKSWVLAVVVPDRHKVQFYRSKNLIHWELASEFGPAGALGDIWECPDIFAVQVRDADGKVLGSRWVLNVNVNPGGPSGGSASQYFVGQFDGVRFVEDHPGSGVHWADWGKDFYASTSFSNIPGDQDRLWIAWLSNWQYAGKAPSLPGRGEMTLARRLSLRPIEVPAGQEPLVLVQEPVLPLPAHKADPGVWTVDAANTRLKERKAAGSVYQLSAVLEPGTATEAGIRLRTGAGGEETVIGVDRAKGMIFVDRTHSGETGFSPDFPARTVAPLKHPQAKAVALRIVVDRSSVEVFAENGETVLTNLIFPAAGSTGVAFYAYGASPDAASARVRDLDFVALESNQNHN
jgi:fructan beta-fructosidase